MVNEGYRDTMVEVDLDAIAHNVQQFLQWLTPGVRLMAAVKGDAYGHGAIPVAQAAVKAGATDLAVAFLDEAEELREAGIQAPILILGHTPQRGLQRAMELDVALTVSDGETIVAIADAARQSGQTARVHVKVDTGMGRLGVQPDEAVALIRQWHNQPGVVIEGLFSHFATADEADKSYARQQHRRLSAVVERLGAEGIQIPLVHCANSAATIDLPEYAHAMVRVGISMYGYYPSPDVNPDAVKLQPALTLKTRITRLARPQAGTGISYGKTRVVDGTRWIATVPIGYADGYSRALSNKGTAIVRGRRVPVIGRVCMDQTMLDVTDAMPVQVGDEVVLYGQQQQEVVTVDEVADLLGTISYEVTCMLDRRIPRIYTRSGKRVHIRNLLLSPLQKL
ncbi:alanine racemase [Desmospora activa DSM 45169]|uniref:Alanine racemase n=2 Tax=Desmospora TaxID=500614 RepID=A0A2T4Z0M9_9BACL|nr:alanine racemase [Desmospora activa DSM 45169]